MTKTYPMSEAQKKANMAKSVAKFKESIKDDEVFCSACRIPVKRLSLFNHNKGKKHIENSKALTKDYYEEMLELFEKFKKTNGCQDISTQLYYLIQSEFFDEDGCEIPSENDKKTDATTAEEKEFVDKDYASMGSILEEKLKTLKDRNLAFNLSEQMEQIDATSKNSRQNYLDIFRTVNSSNSTLLPSISNSPTPKNIKILEEPKIVKKVERIEYFSEEFPEYEDFIKGTDTAKYDCLEFIKDSHLYLFDDNEDILKELQEHLEEHIVENYDELYKYILRLKKEYEIEERRNASRINFDSDEDDEEEEEEDD